MTDTICLFRTCRSDLTSYKGFQYPREGWVESESWNPKPECGNGLHGLREGLGDISLLYSGGDAVAQVLVCDPADVVDIGSDKSKTRKAYVITYDNWQPAWVEYRKIEQAAWVEYRKIEQAAWDEYRKIEQAASVEYRKIKQAAWDKTVAPFLAEARRRFKKITEELGDEPAQVLAQLEDK